MPFKIKICGVTNSEDAHLVAEAGADAIGLNFYEGSKRYVAAEAAVGIVKHLPPTVKRVGVFVNASSEVIAKTAIMVGLDFVQLHGNEPPEFLSELTDCQIIRAFRCKGSLAPVRDYLAACKEKPVAVLVDAYDPDEYGGTGKTLRWPDLVNAPEFIGESPLILAGGLTPANVGNAIRLARPYGVDTASGVEKKTQREKDGELCSAFAKAARSAFTAIE
jgi:phosphoribosylanthranilate isomerase